MSKSVNISQDEKKPLQGWRWVIEKNAGGDKVIWGLAVLLTIASLLVVYSATGSLAYKNYQGNTEFYLFKQVFFIVIGFAFIYFLHKVNYNVYSKIATILFWFSIPLLIYTFLFGVKINEGSRVFIPLLPSPIPSKEFTFL